MSVDPLAGGRSITVPFVVRAAHTGGGDN